MAEIGEGMTHGEKSAMCAWHPRADRPEPAPHAPSDEQERGRARVPEVLRPFVEHRAACIWWEGGDDCDCGLDAAVAAFGERDPQLGEERLVPVREVVEVIRTFGPGQIRTMSKEQACEDMAAFLLRTFGGQE